MVREQRRGRLDAAVEKVALRTASHEPGELQLKAAHAHAAGFGQGGDGQWFLKTGGDDLQGGSDEGQGAGTVIGLRFVERQGEAPLQFVEQQDKERPQIATDMRVRLMGLGDELPGKSGDGRMVCARDHIPEVRPAEAFGLPGQAGRGVRHKQARRVQKKPRPTAAGARAAAAAVELAIGDDGHVALIKGQNLGADIEGAGAFETAADLQRVVNVELGDRLVVALAGKHNFKRERRIEPER